jgi:MerR family transcriptional regulator/heat shock protein HspR
MTPDDYSAYTLEVFARISGVDQETILHYQRRGLVRPLPGSRGLFDDEALRTLRRIQHLREACGVNETGIRIILDLLDELERFRR